MTLKNWYLTNMESVKDLKESLAVSSYYFNKDITKKCGARKNKGKVAVDGQSVSIFFTQ